MPTDHTALQRAADPNRDGNDHAGVPSREEIVRRARALRPVLEAGAGRSERERRLCDESVDAIAAAGLWRIFTPRLYGGWEAGLSAQVDAVIELSAAYPAAGWVLMVTNAHSFMIGNFPVACQDEVFSNDSDARIPGTLVAQGEARRADGGWQVSGRWQFASGIDHGDWVILGVTCDLPSSPEHKRVHVVMPKADLTVDDTWFTLGLRGTGSKDLVAADVFVPDHRVAPTIELVEGTSPHGERHATGVYRLPTFGCLSVQMASAPVGIARAAIARYVERVTTRRNVFGQQLVDSPVVQSRIAESLAELRAAELMVRDAAATAEGIVEQRWMTPDERVQMRWDAAYAVTLCRRAVERVFATDGAHGIYDHSLLQAYFRDLNTACHHAIADFDSVSEAYGRTALGLPLLAPV
jgi:alkylation response protein AidB-like acyl-CoA dehydrogenase